MGVDVCVGGKFIANFLLNGSKSLRIMGKVPHNRGKRCSGGLAARRPAILSILLFQTRDQHGI